LTAGEGVEVRARQLEPLPMSERGEFLSAQELAERESMELRTRYASWKRAGQLLDNDPSTLVHLNFEDEHNLDRNLMNRAAHTTAGAGAMILGCDWGEGRWPGKAALEFNSIDDHVTMPVTGEFEALTYLSWVRVDSLPNRWNGLALVDTFKTGETHWQIRRDGSVELSVRMDGGKTMWDHLVSPPIITQQFYGRWIQLAAVCDTKAGVMSLYFNGRIVAAKFMAKKHLLSLGNLELGNWRTYTKKASVDYTVRAFHGRMDEFTLLSRPMTTEEIRRQYELGRPRQANPAALAEIRPVTE